MKAMITALFLTLCASAFSQPEIRGGDISVEQVGDCVSSLTLRAQAVLYFHGQEPSVVPASVELCWGDGNCEQAPLVSAVQLEWETVRALYLAEHAYPSRGTYVLSIEECCYPDDILSFQSEPDIPASIQNTYTFLSPVFQGCNGQAMPLQPPVDIGLSGSVFNHNPNLYDPDGDSLSYRLAELTDPAVYLYPQEFDNCTNSLDIDPVTGDLRWDTPCLPGHYAFGIAVTEWRDGIPIAERLIQLHVLIEEATGLSFFADPGLFRASPNPVSGTLRLDGASGMPLEFVLCNVHGQPAREWRALQLPWDVSLSDLPPGIYFLRGTTGKRTFAYKIVKQ
ncbi:MAG: T9SS type A sorting domain-containing protein [Phaeodactylibacter sp.]|nr:T9SS type A sorting domain-containing protein [Phaeodactylibacter sp.]MCB9297755.1 T9SS type A sorting domain-containing protein [Lewinellaceae bacterium]